MKIVIATPLYPPQVGGPATYAKHLAQEFRKKGHTVRVVAYGAVEHALPMGLRHFWYFLRLLPALVNSGGVIALDTWSVGLPAYFATRVFGRKLIVRIGGDFLWESYVYRTGEIIRLSDFYKLPRTFTRKEQMVFAGTRFLTRHAETLAFTTHFERDLWHKTYAFPLGRSVIVENAFEGVGRRAPATGRVFVAAGREHPLKQMDLLEHILVRVSRDYPGVELDAQSLPPAEHEARVARAYAVVIPSISEVNPNLVADALKAGKPFICPRDSGAYERFKTVGLFVDMRDEVALESAIRELLQSARYEALSETIVTFPYTHPWSAVAEEFIALF